ncbi:hypothetical protein ACIQNU_04500 [Streptomyces sp. NPDC091292]|uniref:hypothetical protein n=1 Tax=Streptomyces sp. NPDC091292 TaxID=3365991 RepID=UPI003811EC5D
MADGVAGSIVGMLPALNGLMVQVSAPAGVDTAGVPPGGGVVGWVLVADPDAAGGARLEPVFLAGGRAWTPDQYRVAAVGCAGRGGRLVR